MGLGADAWLLLGTVAEDLESPRESCTTRGSALEPRGWAAKGPGHGGCRHEWNKSKNAKIRPPIRRGALSESVLTIPLDIDDIRSVTQMWPLVSMRSYCEA